MPTTRVTVYRNNRPAQGVSVSLEYTGFTQAGFTRRFSTNSDGVAFVEHSSIGRANVYINGRKEGNMNTPGQEVFYI